LKPPASIPHGSCYATCIPDMPSLQELLGILILVAVIWVLLKMARLALRLFFFLFTLGLVIGLLYFVLVR